MYMRKPPLEGLNVVVQFDLDMNYDNVDQCCTISTQLQLSINKAQVEVLILGTLSTTVPYLTHTSYPMTYMDYPLCYEHNDVKTTITLLGHDCLFIRSYNNVIILCGIPKQSSNIWLLFIHLDRHLECWVELYSWHYSHDACSSRHCSLIILCTVTLFKYDLYWHYSLFLPTVISFYYLSFFPRRSYCGGPCHRLNINMALKCRVK